MGRAEGLRVLSRPIVGTNGNPLGVVQVGQSTQFLEATLSDVRRLLELGTVVTLILAGLVGWLLVGRAIRPIGRLRAVADRIIATGNLDERIPAPGATDEIGLLVLSFNRR